MITLTDAERYGIDPAEIKKEVAAEARAKAKAPTKAAQAGKPTARAKGKKANAETAPDATQAAPAADLIAKETVIVPASEWPFPTTGFEKARKAAASAAKGDIEKNAKPKAEVTA